MKEVHLLHNLMMERLPKFLLTMIRRCRRVSNTVLLNALNMVLAEITKSINYRSFKNNTAPRNYGNFDTAQCSNMVKCILLQIFERFWVSWNNVFSKQNSIKLVTSPIPCLLISEFARRQGNEEFSFKLSRHTLQSYRQSRHSLASGYVKTLI